MSQLHLLVSGDYWHEDFRDQLSQIKFPTTMVPLERLSSAPSQEYDLVVLAQSRRNEISASTVDEIRQSMPQVPIVVLLGTWCEGENRSGEPLEGVNNVLWHQWEKRFEKFCVQMNEGVSTDWHLPLTATVADQVRDFSPDPSHVKQLSGPNVGVSASHRSSFESIRDLLNLYSCEVSWIESDKEKAKSEQFDAVCVDIERGIEQQKNSISVLKSLFHNIPTVVLLGFPRKQDVDGLAAFGITQIVSKPFTADELVMSLIQACSEQSVPENSVVPKPSILKMQGKKAPIKE